MLKWTFFLLLLISFNISAQSIDEKINSFFIAFNSGNYKEALKYEKDMIQSYGSYRDSVYVDMLSLFHFANQQTGNIDKAIEQASENYFLAHKILKEAEPRYYRCIKLYADLIKFIGDYPKAKELYQEAWDCFIKNGGLSIQDQMGYRSNLAFTNFMSGQLKKAENLYLENLNFIEKQYGKSNFYYADDLYVLAGIYGDLDEIEKAIALYETSKKIYLEVAGQTDPQYTECYIRQADLLRQFPDKGNQLKAYAYYEEFYFTKKALNTPLKYFITPAVSKAICAYSLHQSYRKEGKADSSDFFINKSFEEFSTIYETCQSEENVENYSCDIVVSYLAMIERDRKNYSKSITFFELALAEADETKKIYYQSQLGDVLLLNGEEKKGRKILNKTEEELNTLLHQNPSQGLLVLSNVKALYRMEGNLEKQVELESKYLKTLADLKGGENNEECLLSHSLLGQAYSDMKMNDSSYYHLQRSKEIAIHLFGKYSLEHVDALFAQILYLSMETVTDVDKKRLLNLFAEFEEVESKTQIDTELRNNVLANKQTFYKQNGNLSKALSLQQNRGIDTKPNSDPSSIPVRIMEAENLSLIGRYDEAWAICHNLFLEFPDMEKLELMKLLRCAGRLPFFSTKNIEESKRLMLWSISLHKDEKMWKESPVMLKHYFNQVTNYNALLLKENKPKEAINNSMEIIRVGKQYFGEEDNTVYSNYYLLGFYLLLDDNPEEAIGYIEKAQKFDEKFNNTNDALYISSFKHLATCKAALKNYTEADILFEKQIELQRTKFESEINFYAENDFEYVKYNLLTDVLQLLNYAVYRSKENPELLSFTINQWFYINDLKLRKGRLYHEQSKIAGLEKEYKSNLHNISQSVQLPPATLVNENIDLNELILHQRRIETEIGEKTNMFKFNSSTYFIRSKLKEDENYVFVIPFRHYSFDNISSEKIITSPGNHSFFIGCIKGNTPNMDFVVINDAEKLYTDGIGDYDHYLKDPKKSIDEDLSSYHYFFKPFEHFFQSSKTYFCPAEVYHKVNLESIYHPEKKKLLIELYNFTYVDPLNNNFSNPETLSISTATLFGGIDYGKGIEKARKENEYYQANSIIGVNTIEYSEKNGLLIFKVVPGLPAEKSGLSIGDVIVSIDDIPIDLNKNDQNYYLNKIRGKEGTEVKLKIYRAREKSTFEVEVKRIASNISTPKELFDYLPGTLEEVSSISKLLEKNSVSTDLYTEKKASEENLKKIRNTDLLHIATHAFYVDYFNNENRFFTGIQESNLSLSPFLRNGLIMSGTNDFFYLDMTKESENGFMNALEISLMNLNETDLVVISGCESGLGTYGIGEGIHGFKEALMRAGAKNIILANYKIEDDATKAFFIEFYSRLMTSKRTIDEVLKETKLVMHKKYGHPYYWSAFQLYYH